MRLRTRSQNGPATRLTNANMLSLWAEGEPSVRSRASKITTAARYGANLTTPAAIREVDAIVPAKDGRGRGSEAVQWAGGKDLGGEVDGLAALERAWPGQLRRAQT